MGLWWVSSADSCDCCLFFSRILIWHSQVCQHSRRSVLQNPWRLSRCIKIDAGVRRRIHWILGSEPSHACKLCLNLNSRRKPLLIVPVPESSSKGCASRLLHERVAYGFGIHWSPLDRQTSLKSISLYNETGWYRRLTLLKLIASKCFVKISVSLSSQINHKSSPMFI